MLSIVLSNTIYTYFFGTTANKVSLFFVLERNLFLIFDSFYFLINLKSLYESYLPLSTLFIILFPHHLIWNQRYPATATVVAPVVSDNGKPWNLFLQFDYCLFFGFHKVISWVLLTIICIIYHFLFQASDAKSTLFWHWYSPR